MKTILDRANAFIGHEEEIDEGLEVTMRRNAFIAGYEEGFAKACEVLHDFAYNVFEMRKLQGYGGTLNEEALAQLNKRRWAAEDKVDTWLIENYLHFNEEENGTTRLQD